MWWLPEWRLPRNPSWRVHLLDRFDADMGVLDTVTSGTIDLNANEPLGGSGSLRLDSVSGIDFRNDRVRVVFDPDIPGVDPWPIATMRFMSPTQTIDDYGAKYEVKLLPKTQILEAASLPVWYSLPAGTNVVDAIVALIENTGESRIAATLSDAVLPSATVFESKSVRGVVNELAAAVNYWSVFTDGSGQFRVEPYLLPRERPTVWQFTEGDNASSILMGEVGREHDYVVIPNVARVYREGDDETPGIEGVYVNDNPDDPESIVNKPEQSLPAESVQVESQGEADALAYRRWADAQSPLVKLTASHEIVPVFPNDVISYRVGEHSGRASVQSQSYELTPDGFGVCSTSWRGI